jgi:hypothetical protein
MYNVVIGQTNIKNYIIEGTYKMDSSDSYESWQDGNFVQHRVIVTSKVNGSFDVACCNKTGSITLSDFCDIFTNAEDEGVILATLHVTNKGIMKTIEAYYKMTTKEHTLLADGTFLDVLTVTIEEK